MANATEAAATAATPTAVATPTPTEQPTPTAIPVPVLPTTTPVSLEGYEVQEEQVIAGYTIRHWSKPDSDPYFTFEDVLTIDGPGLPQVQIEFFFGLDDLSGTDITGEGHPDLIVETFTGGAHCCFSTFVYDLGATLTKVLESPLSNCGGRFEDLDGDGVYEFVTCDDLFAYYFCCYAGSPHAPVVLQYRPGQGYVPATPHFADMFAGDIPAYIERAEAAQPGEQCEWDETTKCAVLPVVLDYLYLGQPTQAWAELDRLYDYPDLALFWAEVMRAVSSSTLYAAEGEMPDAGLPPYYMLQLLTNCGPEQQFVGFLANEEQDACGPDVPTRDIFWLEMELHWIGVLNQGERLSLEPEGCTTDCRLDVISLSDSTRLGSIRLDTAVGFPGAVYRVNGAEGGHWLLRGDLTWEQVP